MTSAPQNLGTVLVVDFERGRRFVLSQCLPEAGYRCVWVRDAESAWAILESECVDVVFASFELDPFDGVELTRRIKRTWPAIEVVVMIPPTAASEAYADAVEAGAAALCLPFPQSGLLDMLARLCARRHAALQWSQLTREFCLRYRLEHIVGSSPQSRTLRSRLAKLATRDEPVLLVGERGTGKRFAARVMHGLSRRQQAPFVEVEAAGSAEQQAFGGTVLVRHENDIVDRLARVREQSARLVVALREQPAPQVVMCFGDAVVQLAPLRDRRADIPAWVQRFLTQLSERTGRQLRLDERQIHAFCEGTYRGNLDDLRILVEHAALAAGGEDWRPRTQIRWFNAE